MEHESWYFLFLGNINVAKPSKQLCQEANNQLQMLPSRPLYSPKGAATRRDRIDGRPTMTAQSCLK